MVRYLTLGLDMPEKYLIMMMMWHRWEIAVAALRIGVVICPATTLLVDKDIEFRCQQTHAKVFIGNSVSVEKVQLGRSKCPDLDTVIQIGGFEGEKEDVVDFKEAIENISSDAQVEERTTNASHPAILFFTSGTTGLPKMVRHNHVSYPLGIQPILIFKVSADFWKLI